jgi:hypothetical protein
MELWLHGTLLKYTNDFRVVNGEYCTVSTVTNALHSICSPYTVSVCISFLLINYVQHVGFEDLTAEAVNSSFFWDTTLCSVVEVIWHFRGIYSLHLQGRRVNQAACWQFLAWLTLRPWRWRLYIPLKGWVSFTRLQSVSLCTDIFRTWSVLCTIYTQTPGYQALHYPYQ